MIPPTAAPPAPPATAPVPALLLHPATRPVPNTKTTDHFTAWYVMGNLIGWRDDNSPVNATGWMEGCYDADYRTVRSGLGSRVIKSVSASITSFPSNSTACTASVIGISTL